MLVKNALYQVAHTNVMNLFDFIDFQHDSILKQRVNHSSRTRSVVQWHRRTVNCKKYLQR